jgi:hypothetical protein
VPAAEKEPTMSEKHSITLPAVVDKIIESPDPAEPEKAQINITEGADPLYKEIRIKNNLTDKDGNHVVLTEGQEVDVTVEAENTNGSPDNDQAPEKTSGTVNQDQNLDKASRSAGPRC